MTEKDQELDLEKLYDDLLDEAITQSRTNFHTFVKLMAQEILPEAFTDGRHIDIICTKFQEVEESVANPKKKPNRVQVFLPPGSMKSRLGNLFCAWAIGRHPNWCFIAIASDEALAIDNYGRPIKDLIDSPRYQAIFPGTVLKKDVQASGRWDTTQKGRFVAKGVGQGIAGRRAHITIVDDAVTEQTSGAELEKINNYYIKGLRTRLLPRGAEIIINTRWYPMDLSGYMEKMDSRSERPWEIIRVPALIDEPTRKLLWRKGDPVEKYAIGTSYWPEFWPTEVLQEKKDGMVTSEWMALYMQTPISEKGGIVKREHFQLWEEAKPPSCKYVIVSMDTAFSTKESADYSAYSVWGGFSKDFLDFSGEGKIYQDCLILLAAGRGRWDFTELCKKAQELDSEYTPQYFIIEDKASGQSLIPELRKRNLPIISYLPEKDKMFRLQACTPYFQAERIWVPKDKGWVEDLVQEVITFPKAPNDDLCDTTSQAILWMRDQFKIDNDGYSNKSGDDEIAYKRKTYWSSIMGS